MAKVIPKMMFLKTSTKWILKKPIYEQMVSFIKMNERFYDGGKIILILRYLMIMFPI